MGHECMKDHIALYIEGLRFTVPDHYGRYLKKCYSRSWLYRRWQIGHVLPLEQEIRYINSALNL